MMLTAMAAVVLTAFIWVTLGALFGVAAVFLGFVLGEVALRGPRP